LVLAGLTGNAEDSGVISFIFFFQAEDGIRDRTVTGVQTCALPIFGSGEGRTGEDWRAGRWIGNQRTGMEGKGYLLSSSPIKAGEIGRASWREREQGGGGRLARRQERAPRRYGDDRRA